MLLKPELNSFVLKPKKANLDGLFIFSHSNLSNFKKIVQTVQPFFY